jgi:hypothetical protein
MRDPRATLYKLLELAARNTDDNEASNAARKVVTLLRKHPELIAKLPPEGGWPALMRARKLRIGRGNPQLWCLWCNANFNATDATLEDQLGFESTHIMCAQYWL